MKIDKIQCDVCGKIVDYNDTNDIISLREEDQIITTCSVEFVKSYKSNRLLLRGIMKNKKDPFHVINIERDLCEECLSKIRDTIIKLSERNEA